MTTEPDPGLEYAEQFAELAEQLHQEQAEQPTLERIATLAVETIDACDWCGVSLRHSDGRITTAASTAEVASRADREQYALGEGPCVETIWQADTFLIEDLSTETRWPRWTPVAADLGIRSILSVLLNVPGGGPLAALNLYSGEPRAFDHTDLAIASIFARHASSALVDARANEGLRTALRSRQTIGVAQGILMQRFGLTLDQSFELLRRYSRDHNVKLRLLAETLVRNGGIRSNGLDVATAVVTSLGLAKDLDPEPSRD